MWSWKGFLFFLSGFIFGALSFAMIFYKTVLFEVSPKLQEQAGQLVYNETLSNEIFREQKVLCLVMTYPENHRTRAIHVKETWGKRCNKLLFMTNEPDPLLETAVVSQNETRDKLWDKTKKSFQYVYDLHFDEFDWFLKADDDTYMVMENLRSMLHQYNTEESLYFGHRYADMSNMPSGYMAGGGYILSKAALKAFVETLADPNSACLKTDGVAEDWEMGHCLSGITTMVDCRDKEHQKRFFPVGVETHMESDMDMNYWYFRRLHYNSTQGKLTCCSDTVVEMHYINPGEMLAYEYFIYNVFPFGVIKDLSKVLPRKLETTKIIKASNIVSFRHQFAKQIHDQAHRQREEKEKLRGKNKNSSEILPEDDSLDVSLEKLEKLETLKTPETP